ncbi:MAG: outer membrane beta-barrel protein [Bacteroidaceae bacterium]|nr:outer membrane beta-barrel protein [Bacteroidaceae bacterium]
MKKVVLTICAALMGLSLSAQDVQVEVTAGANFSTYNMKVADGPVVQYKGVGGFLGAIAEMPLSYGNGFYVNGGLLVSIKPMTANYEKQKSIVFNPISLEIPIHVGYKVYVADDFAIFGEIGPYLGGALSDLTGNYRGKDYNHFLFGAGFKLGLSYSRVKLYGGWDYNFINVIPKNAISNYTRQHNGFIGVAFVF